ncbi:MAG: tyrosine-type recombinase/integrase [Alphaproteobacteria bacterium]
MAQDKRDHGDGGLDARGKDRWRLRYRIHGKRFTKTVRGSIGEARKELRRLLKSGDDDQHVAPDKITVSQWIDSWIALRERKVNARTLERYAELLRLHVKPTLGTKTLQSISSTMVDELYKALETKGLSARTIHHIHTVLGACFRTAEHKNMILRNPVARAEAPLAGDSDAAQALEQDRLTALVNGFRGSTLFPIVAIAAYTGARRGEILALRWSDVDFEAKTLRIDRSLEATKANGLRFKEPKTERSRRSIAIDDGLAALLRTEYEKYQRVVAGVPDGAAIDFSLVKLPSDALVFPALPAPGEDFSFTRPRKPGNVTKEFIRKARAMGFTNLRFHDLRATHETLLLDSGVPVHVVAARCGHDPAVLLRVYAKRTRKADTSAAAIIGTLSRGVLGG